MKNGICYVVGAGEDCGLDFSPKAEDMVIAVDGGFQVLKENKITVDLVVGDFDSLHVTPQHLNVIVLDTEKDDTDMLVAVKEGIKAGYKTFYIYGGTGGRMEHTLANIQLLAQLAQNKMQGFLAGRDFMITAVTDRAICFPKRMTGYVSVFAHSEKAEGVYLKGLKYKLDNATLTSIYPLGVSNEFIGEESTISVKRGTLLIVYPRDNMQCSELAPVVCADASDMAGSV